MTEKTEHRKIKSYKEILEPFTGSDNDKSGDIRAQRVERIAMAGSVLIPNLIELIQSENMDSLLRCVAVARFAELTGPAARPFLRYTSKVSNEKNLRKDGVWKNLSIREEALYQLSTKNVAPSENNPRRKLYFESLEKRRRQDPCPLISSRRVVSIAEINNSKTSPIAEKWMGEIKGEEDTRILTEILESDDVCALTVLARETKVATLCQCAAMTQLIEIAGRSARPLIRYICKSKNTPDEEVRTKAALLLFELAPNSGKYHNRFTDKLRSRLAGDPSPFVRHLATFAD